MQQAEQKDVCLMYEADYKSNFFHCKWQEIPTFIQDINQ